MRRYFDAEGSQNDGLYPAGRCPDFHRPYESVREKLGAIPSAGSLIEIRDPRNTIAHECAVDDLMELYADTLKLAPGLLEAARSAESFVCSSVLPRIYPGVR
jgi:hypothetical protein